MDDTAKRDLINAKAQHFLFKNKMRSYLEGSTEVREEILSDHNQCGLGKWINETGKKKYSSFKEMQELDAIHQTIHETARAIINLKKNGSQQDAVAKLTEINAIGNKIIGKIDELSLLL